MYQAKEKIAENGWNPTILSIEDSIIQDLQFNPHHLFFVGGNEEGCLFLWENEEQLMDKFIGIELILYPLRDNNEMIINF